MNSYRLKPDFDPDDITEVIYRASVLREPIISIANDLGINTEVIEFYVNQYEERAA